MPNTTTNYSLNTYDRISDISEPFVDFRDDIAGTGVNSNMVKIDAQMKTNADATINLAGVGRTTENVMQNATDITTLKTQVPQNIAATASSANTYVGTNSNITTYTNNLLIMVTFNQANTGSSTLNIGSLGAKTLTKIDSAGNANNLSSGDIKLNRPMTFRYNGTVFVLVGANSADQINIADAGSKITATDVEGALQESFAQIGVLSTLTTAEKTNLVGAVNEVKSEVLTLEDEVINTMNQSSIALSNASPVVSIDAPISGPAALSFTAPDLLANQVVNGDFANGTTGWNILTGATLSAANNILSVTGNGTASATRAHTVTNLDCVTNKVIYIRAKLKVTNTNCQNLYTRIGGSTSGDTNVVATQVSPVNGTSYLLAGRYILTSASTGKIQVYAWASYADAATANGKVMEVQQVIAVDLTAMFGAGNEPTQAWCDANFSYVNGIQPLMNPCLTIRGKNLFDKSRVKYGYFYASGTGTENANATYAICALQTIKPSIAYTATNCVDTNIAWYDKNRTYLSMWSTGNKVSPSNSRYVGISILAATNLDTIQFEEGATATSYVPYKESSAILVGEFAKLPNTTYADTVLYENYEAKKLAKVKKVVLDGSITTVFSLSYTGYKALAITGIPVSLADHYPQAVKFDGKIITPINTTGALTGADQIEMRIGYSASPILSVASTNSGWGDSYNPSNAEVTALMNGWKLNNGVFGTPYDGSGTKTWTKWNAADNTGAVTTLPTTKADGWTGWATLWYALAAPVKEEIQVIGSLGVFEDKCTLDVQTGIVYEKANPQLNNTYYKIADTVVPLSNTKYKTIIIQGVFKNGTLDNQWVIDSPSTAYGVSRAYIDQAKFYQTAEYYVLYQALPEEYNNQQISLTAYYSQNLRDAHNELSETVGNVAKDLSLLEEQIKISVKKWDVWIPTLTWTGTTPTGLTVIARRRISIGKCNVNVYLVTTDGNGATGLKISLPPDATPKNTQSLIAMDSRQIVNSTKTDPLAYIDNVSPSNGIQFYNLATLTDSVTTIIVVSGSFEID